MSFVIFNNNFNTHKDNINISPNEKNIKIILPVIKQVTNVCMLSLKKQTNTKP